MERDKSVLELKREARKYYRGLRQSIDSQSRDRQSQKVCDCLKDFLMDQMRGEGFERNLPLRVCVYLAVEPELNLKKLLLDTDFSNKIPKTIIFYVPKTLRSDEGYLYLQFAPFQSSLLYKRSTEKVSFLGITEPELSELQPELVPDIIILPGLAFDLNGGRLGQGGGCYDRYLASLAKEGHRPVTVLVGFSEQLATSPLAIDAYDWPVDYLAFEDKFIKTNSGLNMEGIVNG